MHLILVQLSALVQTQQACFSLVPLNKGYSLHGLGLRTALPFVCSRSRTVQALEADDQERHEKWMQVALCLAERGRLSTAPNPWVGCVIIASDGQTLLAQGFHERKGGPHAEAAALADAKAREVPREQLASATAYVTLEPCHRGPGKSTPPCDEALIESGLRDIHIALADPDPQFGNAGVAYLRSKGARVVVGTGAAAVAKSLRPYLQQRQHRLPWVVLKTASSADGAIACADGTSQWITGPTARAHAQMLRASSQAIIVGSGTAIVDQPRLTLRLEQKDLPTDWLMPSRPPLRVVLDTRGQLSEGPLLDTAEAPTLVCTTDAAPGSSLAVWREAGVEVAVLPAGADGCGVDLDSVLAELYARGVIQVMVEGGGKLLGAFLQHRCAKQLRVYIGACLLGSSSQRWVQAPLTETIAEAQRLRMIGVEQLGNDVCIDYEFDDD